MRFTLLYLSLDFQRLQSVIQSVTNVVLNVAEKPACSGDLERNFIIHPCDPTVVICYLIWPCDIAVHITYLISHSSSLSYNTAIKDISGWVYNKYKLPSCVDIILRTRASRAPPVKTS